MPDTAMTADLPVWDLTDLYPAQDSAEVKQDVDTALSRARDFETRYSGKIADLSGADLAQAIRDYEVIDEILTKLLSYASLLHAGDVTDAKIGQFYQTMREKATEANGHTLFFSLELNRIEEADLRAKLADSADLARYRPWLDALRLFRPHQLSDDIEKLLLDKSVAGAGAWMRLFDETSAKLRFAFRGEELTQTEILHKMQDRDATVRKEASTALGTVLGENISTFALITNTLAKDKEVEDKWRGFDRPISSRNLSNQVEDEVVDALIKAVQDMYPRLSHRYYKIKARWMGQEKLDYWDRLAPPPADDDRTFSWDEAKKIVFDAYSDFSPDMAAVGQRFFDNDWIDVGPRPGKSGGAFAHPTVPSAHPYLLLNFQGKARDIMTLAHELGHGVHQVLAGKQGQLLADTPLTLAETASVFGEMLTFKSMLAATQDPTARRAVLASKIEDMINTVVRQIAFCDFERRVHDARRDGELTPDAIGDIWMAVSEESLGDVFRFDDPYRNYWAYIPHFIHSPFYVYAYAFGDCLVNALYAKYEAEPDGFQTKYMEMLAAGGTLRHGELLAPFGLNAADPDFWKLGLGVLEGFIDELDATF
ncbi:M3 family oligoendopeptidase [Rhodospirillaceae bacterium KN72]|uniref:M3 family oligoendopeptidase n=1 Tax=Pacificispira spongiicola TaxID=2729598 RepID=A0A7Y0DXP1_9PROT|nr:M3 family oligoendopeptidase [Pacificispira spongiicola]NMM43481.1 M3 family oligoendopeptidase [Pacificispira spongiicola]